MTTTTASLSIEDIISSENSDDGICISIIIPLPKPFRTGKEYRSLLQKAVRSAILHLSGKYSKQETNVLLGLLEELTNASENIPHAEGIGLFVSSKGKLSVSFYFPVKEKITISHSFEIRELLYQLHYAMPYFTLHLTEKEARLFEGKLGTLVEINDGRFPMKHEDDYEYSRPARGSSFVGSALVKDYEQDKSRLKKLRYEQFVKEVDKMLIRHLRPGTKLIACGVKNELSIFKRVTLHKENIAGEVLGNYTHRPLHELSSAAWNAAKLFMDQQKEIFVLELAEQVGAGRIVTGLPEIWKAAAQGQAYQLVVEKDYAHPGFLDNQDETRLYIKPLARPHCVLPDAVNNLMQLVRRKDGNVMIVENGMLDQYQHMVLLTRY